MSYPSNTAKILEYLGYVFEGTAGPRLHNGIVTVEWGNNPVLTDQQVIDAGATPEYAVWYAEHGGDPDLTRRRIVKELMDKVDAQEQALRAVTLAFNARTNQIANRLNQVLDAIDSANNLAQMQTNIGAIADLPNIPKTELRTTIFSYVTSGESDGPIQD